MRKLLLISFSLLLPMLASAFSGNAEVDGIWYKIVTKAKTAEVISAQGGSVYSGDIIIPPTIEYDGVTCVVSSINAGAFYECGNLTSVIIGDNVTSIEGVAFLNCSSLTSVTIGTSVKFIGDRTFGGCTSLTSVNISDLDAWYKISFVVETSNPLYYAHHLFLNGEEVKDIAISNSITNINTYAFYGCSSLKSVVIPNSVTYINGFAFFKCENLTTVTIGNSVTTIDSRAFAGCPELTDFICYAVNTPNIYSDTFAGSYIDYATLHVPAASVNKYLNATYWRNFQNIVAIDENASLKCETPTISYSEGKLLFDCATEGVEFVTSVSFADESMQHSSEIPFATTYRVSVYAKKDGYDDSGVATCDVDFAKMIGDVNGDGEITIADAVEIVNTILANNGGDDSQGSSNKD